MKDHENCRLTATPNQSRWTHLQPISCCTLRTASPTQLKPLQKTSPQLQESIPTPRAQMGGWKSGAQHRATMEKRPTDSTRGLEHKNTADKRTRHATQPDLRVWFTQHQSVSHDGVQDILLANPGSYRSGSNVFHNSLNSVWSLNISSYTMRNVNICVLRLGVRYITCMD